MSVNDEKLKTHASAVRCDRAVDSMNAVVVDFVARSDDTGAWGLVLVEQGPWPDAEVDARLRRLQQRLYDCLDAAIDGQVAERFPQSTGKRITIRIDGYGLPDEAVRRFFDRVASQVLELPDYRSAIERSPHVSGVGFELAPDRLPDVHG